MAKKNFYAIRRGIDPKTAQAVENVILTSWNEASLYVQGVKKHGVTAEYKGFMTRSEAEEYLASDEPFLRKKDLSYPMDCLHCYVDGSFSQELQNYAYGLVCVDQGKVVNTDNGLGQNADATSMQQIAGELLGAIQALLYARKHGYKKLVLFFDYKGVCLHATGDWKRDNAFSESYHTWMQNFFQKNHDIEVIFCKVDAHTGDDFNELADGLAKQALGIKPAKVFFDRASKHGLSLN